MINLPCLDLEREMLFYMCNCCNSVNYGNKIFLSCNWINLIDISLSTTNQHLSSFNFDVNEELLKFKVTFVCRNSEKTILFGFEMVSKYIRDFLHF